MHLRAGEVATHGCDGSGSRAVRRCRQKGCVIVLIVIISIKRAAPAACTAPPAPPASSLPSSSSSACHTHIILCQDADSAVGMEMGFTTPVGRCLRSRRQAWLPNTTRSTARLAPGLRCPTLRTAMRGRRHLASVIMQAQVQV